MQVRSNFKHDFLKHLLLGLHSTTNSSTQSTPNEKEKQIKILADTAMALARGKGPNWSRALISGIVKEEKNKCLLRRKIMMKRKNINSRLKVRKKSLHMQSTGRVIPSVLAKRIVRKRTQVLKRIIPGGKGLSDISLLSETLDYVVHLRAQANIMQRLTRILGV